ncbi:MAG TPA: hypothetical protein VJK03_01180 [Candidatus Nanoarchaeia archaeon]|nr:hypothetical protein [Candidatus Nanoarchaeia archaeon]
MELYVRNASWEDIPAIVELENKVWPEGTRAPREKFEKRLAVFPEGFFLAFNGDALMGVSTSEIIAYPSLLPKSWEAMTDNGYIEKTHNPRGNALYVVSLGAVSRSGAGSALLERQKEFVKIRELHCLMLGARIPGYDEYCRTVKEIPIGAYASLIREDGQPYDAELRFYTRNGLKIKEIVPNFMEDDKESRNYGAIMMWENE